MWQVRIISSFICLKQTEKKTAYKLNKELSTVGRGTPEMLIINSKREGDKICATAKKSDWEEIFTKLINLMFDIALLNIGLNIEIGNWAPAPEIMSDPSPKLCGFCSPASKQSYTTAQRWNENI